MKYQTVSSFCLHINREQMFLSAFLLIFSRNLISNAFWDHKCHMLLKGFCFLMLLRGLVVESPLCGDQSPSALWHQLRCELPRWHGPGTQASATRWLDSGTGPHLRHGVITLITRSGAIIEPNTTGRTLTQQKIILAIHKGHDGD